METDTALAEALVDAMNGLFGRHAGHRAAHAKGVLCDATFTPAPDAAALSRAAHLQGPPVACLVRFSHASGTPTQHDGAREGRGLSVKFQPGSDAECDSVCISVPTFVASTPEDFLGLMQAAAPDADTGEVDFGRLGAFLGEHPDVAAALGMRAGVGAPSSLGGLAYNSLHAFGLVDAAGERRWVRFRWAPDTPEAYLEDDVAMAKDPDYLTEEVSQRLASGPVRFTLLARLGEPEDPIDDPIKAWPEERETVALGRLEITAIADDPEASGGLVVMDPMRLIDGIEASPDPILQIRSPAYSVSINRRMGQ